MPTDPTPDAQKQAEAEAREWRINHQLELLPRYESSNPITAFSRDEVDALLAAYASALKEVEKEK